MQKIDLKQLIGSIVNGGCIKDNRLVLTTEGGAEIDAGPMPTPLDAWPVGSVYHNADVTFDPNLYFGGIWQFNGHAVLVTGHTQHEWVRVG